MTQMLIEELSDALQEVGASEEKARAATRAIAIYESRFSRIEVDLSLLKWMVGVNVVLTVTILFKVFPVKFGDIRY